MNQIREVEKRFEKRRKPTRDTHKWRRKNDQRGET
jgi:hypothetical protein